MAHHRGGGGPPPRLKAWTTFTVAHRLRLPLRGPNGWTTQVAHTTRSPTLF